MSLQSHRIIVHWINYDKDFRKLRMNKPNPQLYIGKSRLRAKDFRNVAWRAQKLFRLKIIQSFAVNLLLLAKGVLTKNSRVTRSNYTWLCIILQIEMGTRPSPGCYFRESVETGVIMEAISSLLQQDIMVATQPWCQSLDTYGPFY